MINQIKHNSPSSILSQFNPIASLKPKTRQLVNQQFIMPILQSFFSNKNGIENFCELDPDKLKTEVEFLKKGEAESFVKSYIYKEIVNEISKEGKLIIFKPKYVVTFDSDLTDYKIDETVYPYKMIFNDDSIGERNIKYGVIRLGEEPILYYIFIDLQEIIRFIKTLPEEKTSDTKKTFETEVETRDRLFDTVIFEKQRELRNATELQKSDIEHEINRLEQVRQTTLQGQSGKLRVNLAWNTTDDLDLHIVTPNGKIGYNTPNKTLEYQGIIGVLDVDKNASNDIASNPQENINFNGMPIGLHKIYVNFYSQRERNDIPFTITIIPEEGEGRIFNKVVRGKGNSQDVATFEYKNGELEFVELT